MASVTIRYWAAAREAAGVAEESLDALTLSGALDMARRHRAGDPRFAAVLARSSFLVDEPMSAPGQRPQSSCRREP